MADLHRHVHQFREPQGERLKRRQLGSGVSSIYHGQAQRLRKQRIVVVDVPCHVGMRAGGSRFRNKGTARSAESGDGLYEPLRVCDEA